MNERESQCCGHIFQTVAQRRAHEAKAERGERVQCPCGDICKAGDLACEHGVDFPCPECGEGELLDRIADRIEGTL